MKIRNGFVSNSSSSSFMIDRSKITYEQDMMIQYICSDNITGWRLEATYGTLIGFTSMDNFDIGEFFSKINIPKNSITWANKNIPDTTIGWPDYNDPNWIEKDIELMKKVEENSNNILKTMDYNDYSEKNK